MANRTKRPVPAAKRRKWEQGGAKTTDKTPERNRFPRYGNNAAPRFGRPPPSAAAHRPAGGGASRGLFRVALAWFTHPPPMGAAFRLRRIDASRLAPLRRKQTQRPATNGSGYRSSAQYPAKRTCRRDALGRARDPQRGAPSRAKRPVPAAKRRKWEYGGAKTINKTPERNRFQIWY